MPKYLIHGCYTLEGVRGLLKEGAAARQAHFTANVENLGGKVETHYFAFGADDIYTIVDLPDNVSSASLSLALNAGGGVSISVTVLLTADEVDRAIEKTANVHHRPSGQGQ